VSIVDLPTSNLPPVLDAAQAAQIQRCSQKTVEEMLRDGELPGVKWGEGWALPTCAFIDRLNEIAVEKMLERREEKSQPKTPKLVAVGGKKASRQLPSSLQQAIS
jgi:hypothetical protein